MCQAREAAQAVAERDAAVASASQMQQLVESSISLVRIFVIALN